MRNLDWMLPDYDTVMARSNPRPAPEDEERCAECEDYFPYWRGEIDDDGRFVCEWCLEDAEEE